MKRMILTVLAVLVFSGVASAQYIDLQGGRHSSIQGAIYGSMGNQLAGVMADNLALLNQVRAIGYTNRIYGGGYYPNFPGGGFGMPQGKVGRAVAGAAMGGLGGASVGALLGGSRGAKIGAVAGMGGGALLGALTGGEEKIHIILRNAFESCPVRVYQQDKQIFILSPGTERRVKVPISATIWAEVQVVDPQSGKLFWLILEPGNGQSNLPGGSGFVFHNPELNPGGRR